jgi:hypothetical protein
MENRIKFYVTLIIVGLLFGGCFGKQLEVFEDGNYYYPNWSKYDKCKINGAGADCYKNEKFTTRIYPLTQSQLDNIRYEERQESQSMRNLSNQLNSMGNNMRNNATKMNQIYAPKRYNVYHYRGY